MQNLINWYLKWKSLFLLVIICKKLITIECGNKIFRTLKKSYPSNKNVGVPKTSKPIPKIDWNIEKKAIKNISKNSIVGFLLPYYNKV